MKRITLMRLRGGILLLGLLLGGLTRVQAQSYAWKNVNLQGMGFVTGLVAHPTTANLVYAKTDVGGLYRWNAAGSAWIPLNDGKNTGMSIESAAIDPSNPQVVFIASGNKVFKSTNQGVTWTACNLSTYMDGNGPWRQSGERLMVDPNNGGKVVFFASRQDGLFRSTDHGANFTPVDTTALPPGTDGGQAFVAIDRASGNATTSSATIYVGVHGKGVYKSTDGGTAWTPLAGGPAPTFRPVGGSIANNGTLYVCYATQAGGGQGALYKYTGSGSLQDKTPALTVRADAAYGGVSVEPGNANHVVAYQWNAGGQKSIQRSTDGGTTWAALTFNNGTQDNAGGKNVTEPAYYPSWSSYTLAGEILIDPTNPARAWLANGFAVYRTDNLGGSPAQWTAQMQNLEEIVVTHLLSPPGSTRELLVGVADVVGFSLASLTAVPAAKLNPDKFGIVSGFDYCATKPNYVAYVGSDQYGAFAPFTGISADGGQTFTPFPSTFPKASNGNIAFSATDEKTMVWAPLSDTKYSPLGGGIQVHYTRDGGVTWTPATGAPVDINPLEQYWFASEVLTGDRVNGSKFYLYDRGHVYRSVNHGAAWTQVATNALPSHWKAVLKAHPSVEGQLYFCQTGGTTPLYRSNDGGSTWTPMTTMNSCYGFAFGKAMPGSAHPTLFMTGRVNQVTGVYRSTDLGATWVRISPLLFEDNGYKLAGDMDVAGRVYVATGGRGAFYGDPDPNAPVSNAPAASWVSPAPNAVFPLTQNTVTLEVAATDPQGAADLKRVMFFDANWAFVGEDYTAPYTLTLGSLPAGGYTYNAIAEDQAGNQGIPPTTYFTVTTFVNQPPTAAWASPAPNSTQPVGAAVTLQVNASDPNGARDLKRVMFFDANWNFLGEDYTAPYAFTTPVLAQGTYSYNAIAEDKSNAQAVPPTLTFTVADCGGGSITFERWNNLSGTLVSNLTGNAAYPNSPTTRTTVTAFEIPVSGGDNYGSRVHGYLCVPKTGHYQFYIAGDDNAELWLSSDASPANLYASPICRVPGWTASRQWNKYPEQTSSWIYLYAGSKYYIRALHKEGTGGDNLAVGWMYADATTQLPIPGKYLSPMSTGARLATEALDDPQVILFPNPGDGRFTIALGGPARDLQAVRVSDVYGKPIRSTYRTWKGDLVTLEMTGATPGLYLVRLHLAGKVVTRKVEVMR